MFSVNRYGVIHFSLGALGVHWIPPWCWLYGWRSYIFGLANDSESYFVRLIGVELCLARRGNVG